MGSDLPKVHLARYLIRLGMAGEARGGAVMYGMFMVLLALAGCVSNPGDRHHAAPSMQTAAANYCESLGGERVTRKNSLGTGRYCRLPDGRVENEWQLYRSERLDND